MASERMMRRERLFMKRTPAFLERIDGNLALSSFPVILYHDQPLPREDSHTSKARDRKSTRLNSSH